MKTSRDKKAGSPPPALGAAPPANVSHSKRAAESGIHYPLLPPGSLAMRVALPNPGECPYTLFLGAGASVSSKIPSTADLIHEWRKDIFINSKSFPDQDAKNFEQEYQEWLVSYYGEFLHEVKRDKKTHSEYRALFQYHFPSREERQIKIERLIDRKLPSLGFFYLAGLIVGRRFNRILTTNFDDLLNDAHRTFYDIEQRPIVCAFDSAVSSFSPATQRPKIIKLHGDFLFDDMKSVESELKRLDENMEDKLREMCQEFGLVVVGYGGEDESIMSPLKEMLRSRDCLKKGLHWCLYFQRQVDEERPASIAEERLPGRLQEIIRDHRDQVHLYAVDSFDSLMSLISSRCRLPLPSSLTQPSKSTPTRRFLDAYEQTIVGQAATPEMKYDRREVLRHSSGKDLSALRYAIELADSAWQDGQTERDQQKRYDVALHCFETSVAIINSVLEEADKLDLHLQLRAFSRKAGSLIGMGKTMRLLGMDGWTEHIRMGLENINYAVDGFRAIGELDESALASAEERVASIYFNGCCAYGVLEQYGEPGCNLVKAGVEAYLSALRQFRTDVGRHAGREKIEKLKTDSDFRSLVHMLQTN